MIITLIPLDEVPKVWDVAGPLIDKAWSKAPGFYRAEDIFHRIASGIECLWGVYENKQMIACFTTVIEQYPLSRRLVIHCLAGTKIRAWYPEMMQIMESYARDHGCTFIDAKGREGWRGIGKNSRWRHTASIYEYSLEE